ncbi:hypothetical protein Cgig2_012631 [Carnegiea gigantea]|uniref:Prolamin-like domain-containing protein n=1 Tax=Carnegiea gigantea TaxID=171969 RepID=A0A9Q1K1G4_9CARY|nr:hypothetical protein Cgig2_012631 [Carnegiea gigantea]
MTLNTFFIATTHAAPVPSIDPIIGCVDKISSSCGPKVYAFIFEESGVLSQDCCGLLLKEGKACHDNLTNSILSKGGFSTEETEEILERNSEVWNLCKKSGHIGGTQAAPATIVQPLKGCAGKEVVFDNSGILSEKCCEQLLNAGRECHDSDTNSILSEGEFSKEEREEILARHSEVWNLCKRSGHIGGTQPVPAPTVQPLTGCASKVTSACGPKVYAFVFDKSGVLSEKCCELLLNAGR